tara:strand:+ start:1243 stop:2460 length:1218 start_codon:yes stop_codon:yes gene_type:complete
MANGFSRGFTQTFGPAMQQAQKDAADFVQKQQELDLAKAQQEQVTDFAIKSNLLPEALREGFSKLPSSSQVAILSKLPSAIDIATAEQLGVDLSQIQFGGLAGATQEGDDRIQGALSDVGDVSIGVEAAGTVDALGIKQAKQRFRIKGGKVGKLDIEAIPTAEEKAERIETKGAEAAVGQEAKAAELASRDFLRASAAVDTAIDQNIKFADVQLKKFNLKPGAFLGAGDKLIPKQWNKFKAGFQGSGREAAALIARQLIPGVRAANITRIFSKSAPEIGNTMEGNANNAAASMANAFGNALSQNIKVFDERTGREVNIQDITIDPKTGKPLSQLGFEEKTDALNRVKQEMSDKLNDKIIERVFKVNPNLLQEDTLKRLEGKFGKIGELEGGGTFTFKVKEKEEGE